jgi:hypothetical protein
LGVLDLRLQNKALLIKNLHKFFNQKDIPWVKLIWQAYYSNGLLPQFGNSKGSFWWKDCLSFMNDYRDITSISINNGKTCSLWKDKWMNSNKLEEYPHLFSFAKNQDISFAEAYDNNNESIYNLFHLPLSTVAHEELMNLQNDMFDQELSGENDIWSPAWGDYYSTKKMYNTLIGEHDTPQPILDIWKTCNIPRQKFFAWLMLHNRLNTKEMMIKKNFYVEFKDCIICEEWPEENIMHLFFECSFSQSFWWAIGLEWNPDMDLFSMIADAKNRYSYNFLMEILITGCWSIWEQRNDAIFRGIYPDVQRCVTRFKSFTTLNLYRAKPSLKEGMQSWLDTL